MNPPHWFNGPTKDKRNTAQNDVWNVLKSVMPKNESKSTDQTRKDKSKAAIFNNYFANIGAELATDIPTVPHNSSFCIAPDSFFSLQIVTEDEVFNIIRSLKKQEICRD